MKIFSVGKQNPGCKYTVESLFFLNLRHVGFCAGEPILARTPRRPAEAVAFATAPELRFEPNRKRPNPFRNGAEIMPANARLQLQLSALVQEGWEACGGARCLLPSVLVQLRDVQPPGGMASRGGFLQPRSLALPEAFLWAPNPLSVLGALFSFGGQPRAG